MRSENIWLYISAAPFRSLLNLQFNCSRLCSAWKRRETQLKSWQQNCRYMVTQSALAALNSILGKVAFVKRQTMGSSVEGTEVDFHLLSEDTRYSPFHRVWFEDKLSFSRPFWTRAAEETASARLPEYLNYQQFLGWYRSFLSGVRWLRTRPTL